MSAQLVSYVTRLHQSPPLLVRDVTTGGMPPHPPSRHVTKKIPRGPPSPYIKRRTPPTHSQTMASRHSRRLQGLGPEHLAYEDRCFICLLDLEVQSLKRCQATPCCGKFVHKRCFAKARENSDQCGHCRRHVHDSHDSDDTLSLDSEALRADESLPESEDDDDPIWRMPAELRGPTRIERGRNAIALWRHSARAHNAHTPNSSSWRRLPYHIDITTWFLFWVHLDWFISTNVEQPMPLYVHGIVYTPIPAVSRVRKTIYRLFNSLIPPEASVCLSFVRYRLHFFHIADLPRHQDFPYPYDPNEVRVLHQRMTRFWSPPLYPQDLLYTTLIPPLANPPSAEEQLEYIDNAPTP